MTKLIIDLINAIVHHKATLSNKLWWLAAAEFSLAVLGSILGRVIDYYDSVLADRYSRYVSIQVMRHASSLDLQAYENPVFYDRLERARVQATDRLGMIQSIGRLFQQAITVISLSLAILWFSPWLLLILVACLLPAFLGESHFAFLELRQEFPANSRAAPT